MNSEVEQVNGDKVHLVWLLPVALAGFAPVIRYYDEFHEFFYQGDEWAQLHQMEVHGYLSWVFGFFGENFMPVFKVFWSAQLFAGNGNYHVFMWTGFVVHVLVVFLFGLLLRTWRFGVFPILFSQAVVALNYTHIEIFGQSIQISNLLSYALLLILLDQYSRIWWGDAKVNRGTHCILFLCALLGALSFSRGILNGAVIFVFGVIFYIWDKAKYKNLLVPAFWALVPSLLIGGLIAIKMLGFSSETEQLEWSWSQVGGHLFYHLSLNPFFQQIQGLSFSFGLACKLFVLNAVVITLGFVFLESRHRPILFLLIPFFLGNALLLSLGRMHMSFDTVASWRYQYGILLVLTPILALLLDRGLSRIASVFNPWKYTNGARVVVQVVCILWVSNHVFDYWRYFIVDWSNHRGSLLRQSAESSEPNKNTYRISQFPGVSDARALELIEKYNLH